MPVAFVRAGLPLIPKLTAQAKSYAERLFAYPAIGALASTDARDALILPALGQSLKWDEPALAQALAYTEGYPISCRNTVGEYGHWGAAFIRRRYPLATLG